MSFETRIRSVQNSGNGPTWHIRSAEVLRIRGPVVNARGSVLELMLRIASVGDHAANIESPVVPNRSVTANPATASPVRR
jgi:hypothetical protein